MNNTANTDQSQDGERQATKQTAAKSRQRRRLLWLLPLLLLGSFAVTFVVVRYYVLKIPHELIGTWEVVDGDTKGATLEFRWDGVGYAAMDKNDKQAAKSVVRVRGKRIYMTYTSTFGVEDTIVQTIVELKENEMVLRDRDETTYRLVRLRN